MFTHVIRARKIWLTDTNATLSFIALKEKTKATSVEAVKESILMVWFAMETCAPMPDRFRKGCVYSEYFGHDLC